MSVYLGLDLSTQSLSATLIEIEGDSRAILLERSLPFDTEFASYGTSKGVIRGADPRVVSAPPLMWIDAIDRMMATLVAEQPRAMSRLAALSGCAQQHGSVYLNDVGIQGVTDPDPRRGLADQMAGGFARELSPVWMDSSTAVECAEIEHALGGAFAVAARTGARAFERFTAAQIRAWWKRDPGGYARTRRIHLISSFCASVLCAADAPVDISDASGTNLMDIDARAWWPEALDAAAPQLGERLPAIAVSWADIGPIAPYWQARYGLPPARVIAWSGDNPCSVIGCGVVSPGRLAVSLGTSDTVCGLMDRRPDTAGPGYVSASPLGQYMGTTVFKNGSLARERVRDAHGLDWAGFSAALAARPPGNRGAIMLPWFDPEITPNVPRGGVIRLGIEPGDTAADVRGVVEAQMMAMANHSRWMGADPSVVYAGGGAAGNRAVLQVMADVFGAEVVRARTRQSASLGAALRAAQAFGPRAGARHRWEEIVAGFTDPLPEWRIRPRAGAVATYVGLRQRYAEAERVASGAAAR